MPRFKLLIEYAGTRYSGWQIQQNARTIQGEMARAVAQATGRERFELYGAGRTDAGVHALGQVAHLDIATSLPPATLKARVNDALPADIVLVDATPASHRFHARHDAVARSYVYQICRRRLAFGKPFLWWVRDPLDLGAMRAVAAGLTGFHDFRAFSQDDPGEKSTRVAVEEVTLAEQGPFLLVRVVGSHFLWKMVRRVVGVLVETGRGGLTPERALGFLTGPSSQTAELTAPASGLFLEAVFYEGDVTDRPLQPLFTVPR